MGKTKDLTGMKFNGIIVLGLNEKESSKPRGKDGRKIRYYNCICVCGKEFITRGESLLNGNTKSCGCLVKEKASKRADTGIVGKRFGRLIVIGDDGTRSGRNIKWLCQCDCGNTTHVVGRELKNEKVSSCGCLHKEKLSELSKQMWQDEEYREAHSGENNHNYKPELTDEERELNESRSNDKEWRRCSERVKERDNNTCQCCGHKQKKGMIAHHKNGWDNFKDQRYDDNNLVTLCPSCHDEFHHIHGYGDNTEQQYIEFKQQRSTQK